MKCLQRVVEKIANELINEQGCCANKAAKCVWEAMGLIPIGNSVVTNEHYIFLKEVY